MFVLLDWSVVGSSVVMFLDVMLYRLHVVNEKAGDQNKPTVTFLKCTCIYHHVYLTLLSTFSAWALRSSTFFL